MTEDESQAYKPTKKNMVAQMSNLVTDAKSGDQLFFMFSGHGGNEKDMGSRLSENDGFNETLMPLDYKFAGTIVDDDINKMMVNPLPAGVTLHCLVGACHSGTVMDLPFLAAGKTDAGQYSWEDQARKQFKGTAGGECICFSACSDAQLAYVFSLL